MDNFLKTRVKICKTGSRGVLELIERENSLCVIEKRRTERKSFVELFNGQDEVVR